MQVSVNVSKDYYNKLRNMSDEEIAEHITKVCFKNNDRFLMNYQIMNGDADRFKQTNLQEWFNELKQADNYYCKGKNDDFTYTGGDSALLPDETGEREIKEILELMNYALENPNEQVNTHGLAWQLIELTRPEEASDE